MIGIPSAVKGPSLLSPRTADYVAALIREGDSFDYCKWLIAYFVETYKRSGYRGGLNWYRNIDRNWELSAAWEGMKIRQPALLIAGSEDPVIKFSAKPLEQLPTTVPGLKKTLIIPGSGH